MARRLTLLECRPRWAGNNHIHFDCPEGHEHCGHTVPVSPDVQGRPVSEPRWDRTGDAFATMTLVPSIRRVPKYKTREEAIKDGCLPEQVTPSMLCAMHVNITNGRIVFHGDSH